MVAKSVIIAAAGASAVNAACVFPYAGQYGPGVGSILYPRTDDYPTIGKPYDVKYDGTGLGPKLTFQLLRGPGENVIEQGAIATVDNCGTVSCSFSWTPASNLVPDTTHWALKLIDESNCLYQYTTQFGLHAGTAPAASSVTPPKVSSAAIHPSGSAAPKPSGYDHKPSTLEHKPKPSGSYGGKDDEDCEEDEYEHKPSASAYAPIAHPSAAAPSAYTPPTGGWKATNGSSYTNYTEAATPSYKPIQSNDAGRFAISAFGAVVAFAAAVMVL